MSRVSKIDEERGRAAETFGVFEGNRRTANDDSGSAAPLGTSRIGFTPSQADAWRRVRLVRRQRSSGWLIGAERVAAGLPFDAPAGTTADDAGWVRPPRLARCRWRVSGSVGVHGNPGGNAHFSGTERCGSIWGCPVCSAVIRAGRSAEITEAVRKHRDNGGTLVFLTLTLRHTETDALNLTLNAALQGWSKLISGTAWTRRKERLGITGYVRATEITRGANGWHPHLHALLFLEGEPSAAQLLEFRDWVSSRWAQKVTALGAKTPSDEHGVDLRRVEDGEALAAYLSKIQEKKMGAELARSDLKNGRQGSINPLDLLDEPSTDRLARSLWIEYVTATKGRRAITWSQGLRDRLHLAEERTDEELLDETQTAEQLATIDAETWDGKKNDPGWIALVLETAEREDPDLSAAIRAVEALGDYLDPLTGELLWSPADRDLANPESLGTQEGKNDHHRNSGASGLAPSPAQN